VFVENRMYKSIYVPVDNSPHSNRAIACALALGRAFEARMAGSHVYAAALHDYRFKQMEYTLPEEYLDEVELERQRKIHDSLITMGLKLISDSYLATMARQCEEQGLAFQPRMMDGKHHVELLRDIRRADYDLVVMGSLGLGRARDSVLGSVCERVVRGCDRDVWVVKRLPAEQEPERDTILVGIDGSPQSFGALMTALDLARRLGKRVETIAVYDPYLHYSVFNGIVDVLTEQAAKVFRFEEQNQLHEEIIDTGLAQIYQSHLNVAETMAAESGATLTKTLLDGKAFQKILDRVRKIDPWLLVIGRIGVHSDKEETGLGSTAENLLRSAPCDVLLTTRVEVPRLDVRAEEAVRWTPEAEERMKRVPEQVRGVARTGVLRIALEKGHSVVTNAVIDEAMERFMPRRAAEATLALAEAVALERARTRPVALCRQCGVAATQADAVVCTVCGGRDFEHVSAEMIERIAAVEGGLQEETSYDGRKLSWTQEAKKALWTMKDAYQRRRVKARVEKRARMRKLTTVTLDFAREVIEEETGTPLDIVAPAPLLDAARGAAADGPRLLGRDDKNNPLVSALDWTADALKRILRVPAGFMRDQTQERIEALARERSLARIDLPLVEEGIEVGKRLMAEMIATYKGAGAGRRESVPPVADGNARPSPTPAGGGPPPSASGNGRSYLNEVRLVSAGPRHQQERGGDPPAES
jgi:nucleotide-binding universal stress UspA family protein